METDYQDRVSLPITNELRRGQMEIMRRWMDSDPAICLKYSDTFFGPYQRELVAKFGTDYDTMVDYIWGGTMFASVDIRYILWTLDKYAGMGRILDELGL